MIHNKRIIVTISLLDITNLQCPYFILEQRYASEEIPDLIYPPSPSPSTQVQITDKNLSLLIASLSPPTQPSIDDLRHNFETRYTWEEQEFYCRQDPITNNPTCEWTCRLFGLPPNPLFDRELTPTESVASDRVFVQPRRQFVPTVINSRLLALAQEIRESIERL